MELFRHSFHIFDISPGLVCISAKLFYPNAKFRVPNFFYKAYKLSQPTHAFLFWQKH